MKNNLVYIGKIVNTHGIKGEVRILSDFESKDKVFKKDIKLYIGPTYQEYIINTYRHHKCFDMVTFKNITNINDVLPLKGLSVYINRDILNLKEEEYILSDLIGYKVTEDKKTLGLVKDYYLDNGNTILEIQGEKHFYIPLKSQYIKDIDVKNKEIITNNGSDLIL